MGDDVGPVAPGPSLGMHGSVKEAQLIGSILSDFEDDDPESAARAPAGSPLGSLGPHDDGGLSNAALGLSISRSASAPPQLNSPQSPIHMDGGAMIINGQTINPVGSGARTHTRGANP